MAKKIAQKSPEEQQIQFGNPLLTWEYEGKPHYERGLGWYVGMGITAIVLLLYAIFSANFLFALIILMFALIVYLSIITGPERKTCTVTDQGIRCGRTFYPYRDLERFWFVYDPPMVKKLYIVQRGRLAPMITVQLEKENPNEIRKTLNQFMAEDLDRAEEPFTDLVGRILKI